MLPATKREFDLSEVNPRCSLRAVQGGAGALFRMNIEERAATVNFRLAPPRESEPLRAEFDALAEEWHAATDHLSVIWQQAMHPAFQAIIGMGDAAVPHILRHMKQGRDPSWFWALRAIARNRDAPIGITDCNDAIVAWERWAQGRGLL